MVTEDDENIVSDGFGTSAPAICHECGCRSIYVCRPGDIRCGVCYDGNPKEWYTGEQCPECRLRAVHNNRCLCCDYYSTVTEDDIHRNITDFEYGYLTWGELIDWLKEHGLRIEDVRNTDKPD
jgi:hypothetical protein